MLRLRRTAFLLFSSRLVLPWGQQKTDPAIERRIDALLKQMTIEEKAGQLSQFDGDNPQNLEIIKQGGADRCSTSWVPSG